MVEFLSKLGVVTIKLLELTQFASLNLSIYFNFVRYWVLSDNGRFSVRSPLIEKSVFEFKQHLFYFRLQILYLLVYYS